MGEAVSPYCVSHLKDYRWGRPLRGTDFHGMCGSEEESDASVEGTATQASRLMGQGSLSFAATTSPLSTFPVAPSLWSPNRAFVTW